MYCDFSNPNHIEVFWYDYRMHKTVSMLTGCH